MKTKMYEEQKEKILKMLSRYYKIDKNVELLLFIKAIKEVCKVSLKEAKDIADSIRVKETFDLEEFSITAAQWDAIVDICKHDLQWEYQH